MLHSLPFIIFVALLLPSEGLYQTTGDVLHFLTHAAQRHEGILRFKDVQSHHHAPLITDKKAGGVSFSLPIATLTNSSSQVAENDKRVAVLVFGEHAREVITTEVAIWLIKVLIGDVEEIQNWKEMKQALSAANVSSGSVKDLHNWTHSILERLIIKVLPIENTDGRALLENGDLCKRKTRSEVDLNRNWEFAWIKEDQSSEEYGGTAPFSEPQSRYLRDQAAIWKPIAFVNVHSGESAVYTPWDSRKSIPQDLPKSLGRLISSLGKICDCMAGPSGVVSNYLAFGTSMDYMHTALKVPYSLTLEVYGGGGEGKLKGRSNAPLSSYETTIAHRLLIRRMLRGDRLADAVEDPIINLYRSSSQNGKNCFQMFNPVTESDYREVVSRWVVMLMVLLNHVAIHSDGEQGLGTVKTN